MITEKRLRRLTNYAYIQWKDRIPLKEWKLQLTIKDEEVGEGGANFYIRHQNGYDIGRFSIRQFPGCCAIAVSYHSNIDPKYRGQKLGTLFNKMRMDIARLWGYGAMICTDVHDNVPSRKLLANNGWSDIAQMRNPRTKNKVFISTISLVEGGIVGKQG